MTPPRRRLGSTSRSPRSAYHLDAQGNATGGIRTPWVDAPTAVLSGLGQTGVDFAVLFGRTVPFDEATLAALYPGGKDEYLERFTSSLQAAINDGFLLAEDRDEILGLGAASYPLRLAEE